VTLAVDDGGAGSLLRRSTTVTLFTALGVVAGFVVDLLIVARFGVGIATDAFFAAYTLPFILVTTLAAIQPVLVTVLSGCRGDDTAFGALLNLVGLAALMVTGGGMVAARPLIAVTAPGFGPDQASLAAHLARILFLRVLLAAVSEVCRAGFYARQRFALAAFSSALPGLVAALLLAVIRQAGDEGVRVVAWSLVVGSLLQAVLLAGVLFARLRVPYRPGPGCSRRVLHQVAALVPAPLAGLLLRQGVVLAERLLGSYLPAGSLTALSYANRLTMIAAGILFDGPTTVALPSLAALWSEGRGEAARAGLSRLLRLIATVALPAGLALAALSTPLVRLFFERGQVAHQAALLLGTVLGVYALSLPFIGPYRAVQTFSYAIRRPWPVVFLHGGLSALAVALDLALVGPLGVTGLAWGFVLGSSLIAMVGLVWMIRRAGDVGWRALSNWTWRLGLASGAMAAVMWGVSRWLGAADAGTGLWRLLFILAVSGLAGLLSFLGLGAILRLEVISVMWNRLKVARSELSPDEGLNGSQ